MKVNQKIVLVVSKASIASNMLKIMSSLLLAFVMGTTTFLWCSHDGEDNDLLAFLHRYNDDNSQAFVGDVLLNSLPEELDDSALAEGDRAESEYSNFDGFVSAQRKEMVNPDAVVVDASIAIKKNNSTVTAIGRAVACDLFRGPTDRGPIEEKLGSFQDFEKASDCSDGAAVDVAVCEKNVGGGPQGAVKGQGKRRRSVVNSDVGRGVKKAKISGKKLFECPEAGCDYATPLSANLKRHQGKHSGKKPFKCEFEGCSYASAYKNNLREHKKKIHEKKYETNNSRDVAKHRKTHSEYSNFDGFAGAQPKEMVNPDAVVVDASIAIKKNNSTVTAIGRAVACDLFRGPTDRGPIDRGPIDRGPIDRGPIEEKLGSLQDFEKASDCSDGAAVDVAVCEKNVGGGPHGAVKGQGKRRGSVVNSDVGQGVKKARISGEKLFQCPEAGCDYTTFVWATLKKHQEKHSGKKSFKCSVVWCDYATNFSANLKRHEGSHIGEKRFVCDYEGCSFASVYDSNLKNHKKNIHEKKQGHVCGVNGCLYVTNYFSQLKKHQEKHFGEKIVQRCGVPGCGYRTFQLDELKTHQEGHQQAAASSIA